MSNEELLNLFINLTNNKEPPENGKIKKSIEELQLLLDYIKTFNCTAKKVVFDPSLARGLDYYTGAIYEVVIQGIFKNNFFQTKNFKILKKW